MQEVKVSTTASSAKHSELAEALKAYRAKAENYLTRLEQADIERAKAVNGEKFGMSIHCGDSNSLIANFIAARKALDDLEKSHAQALKERKVAEGRAAKSEQNLRDLSAKLEHGDRQSSDLEQGRQRLEDELQEERDQHASDLAERDFAMNQTQITYQSEQRSIALAVYPLTVLFSAKLAELSDGMETLGSLRTIC